MKTKKNNVKIYLILFVILFLPSIHAAADFAVNSFSCTPSEVAINDVFSCAAQIKNNGDAAGSVSTATLYPDSNDWLEDSTYAQASGTSVDPGQTTEVTFTGLRAVKSGEYGFSKIMLDDVTDTYVADNNVKENIINIIVSVSNSASSKAKNTAFDSTAEITAGGNIDAELTFTVTSGGCTIGSQTNPKTISGMSDGNIQSRSWSVTMGTSGDCKYKVTASATGTGGVATKEDSDSSTVSCTDCSTGSSGSSGSSSGGGGSSSSSSSGSSGSSSGGVGTTVETIDELPSTYIVQLQENENIEFGFNDEKHYVSVVELTETSATIIVESEKQTFNLRIGETKNVNLIDEENEDQKYAEISIKLDSINTITNKARFTLKRLTEKIVADESEKVQYSPTEELKDEKSFSWIWIIMDLVFLMIIILFLIWKRIYSRKLEV